VLREGHSLPKGGAQMKAKKKAPKTKKRKFPIYRFSIPPNDSVPFIIKTFQRLPISALSSLPHSHDYYQVIYITHGEGRHIIDFEAYKIDPPVIYFTSPWQVHFYQVESPIKGYSLWFDPTFFTISYRNQDINPVLAFFNSLEVFPHLKLNENDRSDIEALIRNIEEEYQIQNNGRESVLRSYVIILLNKIKKIWDLSNVQASNKGTNSLVYSFKQLVSKYYINERSVQFYSEKLNVTTAYLGVIVKSFTDQTPGEIIRYIVTLEAKRLLANTDLKVVEIGDIMSFADPSYFGRYFKREVGMSPLLFRKHIREKYRITRISEINV
jgi:AraC-like DNA-binding protein